MSSGPRGDWPLHQEPSDAKPKEPSISGVYLLSREEGKETPAPQQIWQLISAISSNVTPKSPHVAIAGQRGLIASRELFGISQGEPKCCPLSDRTVRSHIVRPTNRRIAQLEQENAALRQQCLQLGNDGILTAGGRSLAQAESSLPVTSPAQSQNTAVLSHSLQPSPNDYPSSRDRGTSHPEVPDSDNHRNSTSLYHGPTSTVYDDTANTDSGGENTEPLGSPAQEEWARHLLFAQTARQSKCAHRQ